MSWSKPWNIWLRGQQSFDSIKHQLQLGEHAKENERRGEVNIYNGRSQNYAIREHSHRHPLTEKYEQAMCVRHYDTDILQFFKDGSIRISDYDSLSTRHLISALSPITRFNGRYGPRWRLHGSWSDPDYPLNGPVVIHPDGYVRKLTEWKWRVKKTAKPERSRIRKNFTQNALARITLSVNFHR